MKPRTAVLATCLAALALGACRGGGDDADGSSSASSPSSSPAVGSAPGDDPAETMTADTMTADTSGHMFQADVWADNYFEMYVDGAVVGTDSVSITTERSFNKETFTFTAAYPFTLAIQAKDYMEDESGLEYIGTDRQQMGDGGLIAQITDMTTGEVVAATGSTWSAFVTQQAPLDTACATSDDPATACTSREQAEPDGWASPDFDASDWTPATEYTADQVGAKDGYDEVSWDGSAKLVWAGDLQTDNIVLFRTTVGD